MIKVNLKEFIETEREMLVSENCEVKYIEKLNELLEEEMEYKDFLVNFRKYWGEVVMDYGDSEVIYNILESNIKEGRLSIDEGVKVWLEYWNEETEEDREERKECFIDMIEGNDIRIEG